MTDEARCVHVVGGAPGDAGGTLSYCGKGPRHQIHGIDFGMGTRIRYTAPNHPFKSPAPESVDPHLDNRIAGSTATSEEVAYSDGYRDGAIGGYQAAEAAVRERVSNGLSAKVERAVSEAKSTIEERVSRQYQPLLEAAQAVVDQWDAVLPSIRGAEGVAYVHGWRYEGPPDGIRPQMDALRAALRPTEPGKEAK